MIQLSRIRPRFLVVTLLVMILLASASLAQSGDPPDKSLNIPTEVTLSPDNWNDVIEFEIPDEDVERLSAAGTIGNSQLYGWTHNAGSYKGKKLIRYRSKYITQTSIVLVSASEGYYGNRHMGAAKFTVHNVVPKNGYVDIWVEIDWHDLLPLALDIFWIKR